MGELQWTELLKLVFLKIFNSAHKAGFLRPGHIATRLDINLLIQSYKTKTNLSNKCVSQVVSSEGKFSSLVKHWGSTIFIQ